MSITALEMVTDALRLSNVIDESQAPSAEEGQAARRTLNAMMGQWHRDGIELGWQSVDELTDTLPVDPQDERAVKYNLAVELAGEYGIEPLPRVQRIADRTYGALSKAHRKVVECSLDLLPLESARAARGGTIDNGGFS